MGNVAGSLKPRNDRVHTSNRRKTGGSCKKRRSHIRGLLAWPVLLQWAADDTVSVLLQSASEALVIARERSISRYTVGPRRCRQIGSVRSVGLRRKGSLELYDLDVS